MSQRLARIWLLPVLLFASQTWALGLGNIRLSSALNEPLRAEIELLSATPEELANLNIQLASAETFARYGLERPLNLDNLQFNVIASGRTDGNVVEVRSLQPVTEPFITFLVEAVWSRGRLLREYTLLLDPPTFAPPPVAQSSQTVTAPSRSPQADSGTIQRPAAAPPPVAPAPEPAARPAPQPPVTSPLDEASREPAPEPAPEQVVSDAPVAESVADAEPQSPQQSAFDPDSFDSSAGGDYQVQRGDTLWRLALRFRPDNRLTINQTMIAIFEANPEAFSNNINIMSAGASLRIPSADDIFNISRGDALAEAQRQHEAWGGAAPVADSVIQPSLTLVPPDDEPADYDGTIDEPTTDDTAPGVAPDDDVVMSDEQRIYEIEQLLLDHRDSIIEIEDNELATLQAELARLRGEEYVEPAIDDALVDDDATEIGVDDDAGADVSAGDDAIDGGEDTVEDTPPPTQVATRPAPDEGGIVDTILGVITGFWGILSGGLILVLAVLVWFARRAARDDDDDSTGVWNALDEDDLGGGSLSSTESLRAMSRDDETAILVEEGTIPGAATDSSMVDTLEVPAAGDETGIDSLAATGTNESLEDTFSSETAINLDQSDPIAEADFHMAYGLYDQAADLINGALAAEPQRQDLLGKLCEVYFVWGNRDAFIDAATRMRGTIGDDESNADWDKIVIMGQQIAGDHEMFSGVSAGAATKAVDLSFEGGVEEAGSLDMEFGGPDTESDDVIDLGSATGESAAQSDVIDLSAEFGESDAETTEVAEDLMFDEPDIAASATQEMPAASAIEYEPTLDVSTDADATGETPTIEQQFQTLEETGVLPSLAGSDSDDDATELASLDDDEPSPVSSDETAEINLDDLGLDLGGLAESGIEDIVADGDFSDLEDTAESHALKFDDADATAENPDLDGAFSDTGSDLDADEMSDTTSLRKGVTIGDLDDTSTELETGDITGRNPAIADDDSLMDTDTGIGIDTSLLDATGQTQILSADMAVDTAGDISSTLSDDDQTTIAPVMDSAQQASLSEDVDTLLAPPDDDDFDFAKTEALPKDAFTGNMADGTNETPTLAGSMDMDLDLDDLTAALKVSEIGDTVNQARDDATVEQPRIRAAGSEVDLDVGMQVGDADDDAVTTKIGPDDMTGDLHDARTMTEVGTKLDLARAYVDMGDPGGARSILDEVLDEGDEGQKQQAQQLLDSLPG